MSDEQLERVRERAKELAVKLQAISRDFVGGRADAESLAAVYGGQLGALLVFAAVAGIPLEEVISDVRMQWPNAVEAAAIAVAGLSRKAAET